MTPANRGGRWCSVRVCGNRTKARPAPAPAPAPGT
ncbi:CGNR zinc finger domain-containing protein [Kitasatospora sp. NPDC058201]